MELADHPFVELADHPFVEQFSLIADSAILTPVMSVFYNAVFVIYFV